MDFLSAFQEPGVLISLSVSLLLYFFPDKGRVARIWLLTHIGSTSTRLRRRFRLQKWKYRKKFLLKAYNPYEVHWQVIRTYSLMLMFAISITTYVLLIAIGPLKDIGKLPEPVQYFIYAPVLVFETLWLLQKDYAQSLVRAAGKRVTSQSTSRLRRRVH